MPVDRIKANGVHYTPATLAGFLAAVTAEVLDTDRQTIDVLDPACGDGALLWALAGQLPQPTRSRLVLHGYETDPDALDSARRLLAGAGVADVDLRQQDFLALPGVTPEASPNATCRLGSFDAVIANPPYVRTQVLGSARAQELAGRFGLSGRIDLYQAFAQAMANVLRPGGVLGLLVLCHVLILG
jgi:methylase of polypeptide subunit release factors